jgi:hypothetical protein
MAATPTEPLLRDRARRNPSTIERVLSRNIERMDP